MIDPVVAFAIAEQAFEAANVRPELEACYQVAGRVLALRFAGTALAMKLLPAFAHLLNDRRLLNWPEAHIRRRPIFSDASMMSAMGQKQRANSRHSAIQAPYSSLILWQHDLLKARWMLRSPKSRRKV